MTNNLTTNNETLTGPNGSGTQSRTVKKKTGTKKIKNPKPAKRGSGPKPFPGCSFQDAMEIAIVIQRSGVDNRMRRLTIFDELKKSPDSGPSRMLVINSGKYGLTTGGYKADYLDLNEQGRLAVDPETDPRVQVKARFELAIEGIPPFKHLYERLSGNKLPSPAVLNDLLIEIGLRQEQWSECVDIFIVNLKFLGLLRTIAGAERVLKIDHALEDVSTVPNTSQTNKPSLAKPSGVPLTPDTTDWRNTCFYITPIGADDSELRKHSDMFLNCVVEPALRETGLKVVRADQIGRPGMIGAQIIEHVLKARLVIADLSYHNPNVFYELCLRHASGLPTVQIIRSADEMPFDLQQLRTIKIDTTDIYTLLPRLEVYKAEIATQVRRALEDPDSVDNPIRTYCPGFRVGLPDDIASLRN
jgi:hypothetical protein